MVRALSIALVFPFLLAGPLMAQRADFLFEQPRITLSVFGGWSAPREGGQLFEDTREWLTVERGDFAAPLVGGELGIWLSDRVELGVGVEHTRARERSEFQDWEGTDGLPIVQTTELSSTRASLTGRFYLLERGRAIGQHAWIPAGWSPYVGGGGGVTWYEFAQSGEFVDFQTLNIFNARLHSRGRGAGAHVTGGLDLTLSPSVALRGEFRYHWDDAAIDRGDFWEYGRIDLSGARATLGVALRH